MNTLFVLPANKKYSPFLKIYESIFKENDKEMDILFWDRLKIEEDANYVYRKGKKSARKRLISYYKFSKFALKIIKEKKYKKVIISDYPTAFFLTRKLSKINVEYLIDIRDLHKLMFLTNTQKVFIGSKGIVISSPGFMGRYILFENCVISHNLPKETKLLVPKLQKKEKYIISCIGYLKHYTTVKKVIDAVKNNSNIESHYHGVGNCNDKIDSYIKKHKIKNVFLSGGYKPEEENELYHNSDFIDIILPLKHFNAKRALPNRLYRAVINGKPIIALEGTYVSKVVEKFNLGIVIKKIEELPQKVKEYVNYFDFKKYDKGRVAFMEEIKHDESNLLSKIRRFVKSEQ